MRKAADLINEYFRETSLSSNRADPIGAGANAVVYQSDVPGNVMKQSYRADTYGDIEREANLQAIAAEMGIAPRVAGLETFPGGIGNRIEMADVRDNFETSVPGKNSQFFEPEGRDAIRVNQQLGQLALKGVRLEDRHGANVLYNKMTGRPMQIDFGIAGRVKDSEQVATLADATAEGFEAAGLKDIADIYRATVMDFLEGGQVAEAMDVAKQGFSRLQKIKAPLAN
tara:strand:- start:2719 stop:3399 length:681 start_codon:yes stop_codon:yes gene_type:complete